MQQLAFLFQSNLSNLHSVDVVRRAFTQGTLPVDFTPFLKDLIISTKQPVLVRIVVSGISFVSIARKIQTNLFLIFFLLRRLAFSPDAKHMYIAYQKNGKLFDIYRQDGRPFNGRRLDVKYHGIGLG